MKIAMRKSQNGDVMGKDGPGSFCLFDTASREITLQKPA
jgi:hypothetical protein